MKTNIIAGITAVLFLFPALAMANIMVPDNITIENLDTAKLNLKYVNFFGQGSWVYPPTDLDSGRSVAIFSYYALSTPTTVLLQYNTPNNSQGCYFTFSIPQNNRPYADAAEVYPQHPIGCKVWEKDKKGVRFRILGLV